MLILVLLVLLYVLPTLFCFYVAIDSIRNGTRNRYIISNGSDIIWTMLYGILPIGNIILSLVMAKPYMPNRIVYFLNKDLKNYKEY